VVLFKYLLAGGPIQAQAGRYIPPPVSVPTGGGAGGVRFIPFVSGGHGDPNVLWIILAILALIVAAAVGWRVGRALGRRRRGRPEPRTAPAMGPDLIRDPAEVAGKAARTRRLLEFLAYQDPSFDPERLRERVSDVFLRVQEAWRRRDYGPVRGLVFPEFLAVHEALLRQMRAHHEVNRIEELRIERLEIVHVLCPGPGGAPEAAALITFRARAYFVDDRTGAHTRGPKGPTRFQEFWVFRRQGGDWRLHAIEPSRASGRLGAENRVAELSARQLESAQDCITL
jgi:predicted lipid-binding transport protein (Tim44 family)